MLEIERPENFITNKRQHNPTIGMLDHMMFNIKQLKVENYVRREPKYLSNNQNPEKSSNRKSFGLKRFATKRYSLMSRRSSNNNFHTSQTSLNNLRRGSTLFFKQGSNMSNTSPIKPQELNLFSQKSLMMQSSTHTIPEENVGRHP